MGPATLISALIAGDMPTVEACLSALRQALLAHQCGGDDRIAESTTCKPAQKSKKAPRTRKAASRKASAHQHIGGSSAMSSPVAATAVAAGRISAALHPDEYAAISSLEPVGVADAADDPNSVAQAKFVLPSSPPALSVWPALDNEYVVAATGRSVLLALAETTPSNRSATGGVGSIASQAAHWLASSASISSLASGVASSAAAPSIWATRRVQRSDLALLFASGKPWTDSLRSVIARFVFYPPPISLPFLFAIYWLWSCTWRSTHSCSSFAF